MEFTTNNNNRWDTTRKKYILSLKNRIQNHDDVSKSTINDMDNNELLAKRTQSLISECTDSQDFSLRLSENSVDIDTVELSHCNNVDDESEKKEKTSTIIICDSSDDESESNKNRTNKNYYSPITKTSDIKYTVNIISSSDESEVNSSSQKKNPTSTSKNTLTNSTQKYVKKCSALISNDNIDLENINDDKIMLQENNFTTVNQNKEKPEIIQTTLHNSRKIISTNSGSTKSAININRRYELKHTPNSVKSITHTTPLSKKDVRTISKVIKSSRAIFTSPAQWQRRRNKDRQYSDTSEDTETSHEIDYDNKNIKHPAWIDETDSESDKTTGNDPVDQPKLLKTHVNHFHDSPTVECDPITLSERKKEEISRWLLSNPVDTRSETSMSYVPPSEQSSLHSGNSSLDRLELKYETPNNRDRFKTLNIDDNNKIDKVPAATRQIQSAKQHQTTMDNFLRKVKRGNKNISYFTPIPITRTKKKVTPSPPAAETNIQIADCADILDKLYGNVWRDKADDLLPTSEPKKIIPKLQDRAVQTECKKIMKPKKKLLLSPVSGKNKNDDKFKAFTSNIKSNMNSTKKSEVRNGKWRDSFINDDSSPECSNGETTFQTAMTTPLIPNYKKKEAPTSALTIKAIEICDSDTEDSDDKSSKRIINRRKLSFSDDETDFKSSPGTSEFDPEDIIPPKTVIKPTKKILPKPLPRPTTNIKSGATKSFLASLSPSVPLANAHPEAKKYRINYKNTRDDLCKHLYKLYNEKIFNNQLPDDMLIEWNVRMRGTAGFCYNKTKKKTLGVERSSRIVLATKILDAPDRLRDTLVHEMCHAATWLINEVSDGHGPFWQAWASKAMKTFPELPSIKRCHDYKIATKYTYRCVSCGYSIGRHSKSLDVERKRCGHCYGKFELLINKTTKAGTVQVKTPSNKKPSGFALFVKENYHLVKKERRDVGHKEVMQILGQQFSAVKISNKNNEVEEQIEL